MTRIPVVYINDFQYKDERCFVNVSASDALELYMSTIELHCLKANGLQRFNKDAYTRAADAILYYYNYVPVV